MNLSKSGSISKANFGINAMYGDNYIHNAMIQRP